MKNLRNIKDFCYSDPGAEIESDNGASIDTQPEPSFDGRFEATIDRALEAPIDSDLANEIEDFPEGSIKSWENDYYQPSFAIHTATPSKRKIRVIQPDEYGVYRDEDGIAHTLNGKIINMPEIYTIPTLEDDRYTRDEIMEIM
ncbi:hypothetical protein DY000_02022729 [Brassica cretica]|uniref:Uncharacterized protein n=1 Tax=Brassica cretica TaxID=69181 RepID=A0ABQ7EFD0_BRACR|nr:hypothetical protein DY000_02022729 [Brassica cretica]